MTGRLKVKGSFARNFAVTFSGNSLAVLLGFLFTPFIARTYSPESYGNFAVYLAISQNIALAISLQFPRAFVIPAGEGEFLPLYRATFVNILIGLLLAGVLFLSLRSVIVEHFEVSRLGSWILVLPITIFLHAVNDSFRSYNVRFKMFTRNASNQVVASLTARPIALGWGILSSGNFVGFIVADTVTKLIETCYLGWRGAARTLLNNFRFSLSEYKKVLREYKNYPFYILPGIWLAAFSIQLPIFFTARYFSPAVAGNYSFANSLLSIPVALLSGAIAPVFLQKASETHSSDPTQMPRLVSQLANNLFYAGLLPIMVLTVFGDVVFRIILGPQWQLAGQLAGFLGIHYLFYTVSSPLVTLYRIYKREHLALTANVVLLLVSAASLALGYWLGDIYTTILAFTVGNVVFSLFNIVVIFSLVKVKAARLVVAWLLSTSIVGGVLVALRQWLT